MFSLKRKKFKKILFVFGIFNDPIHFKSNIFKRYLFYRYTHTINIDFTAANIVRYSSARKKHFWQVSSAKTSHAIYCPRDNISINKCNLK